MRRSTYRCLCAVLFALLLPMQGCTDLADWQKVQSKIPALEDAFLLIIQATAPRNLASVQAIQGQINSELEIIGSVLQQYQANLSAAAPADVSKVNAAVAAITALLPRILTAVHATDQQTSDLISAFVDAIEGIFFPELASLLPATASASASLSGTLVSGFAAAKKSAVQQSKLKIRTVEEMIKRFNKRQHKAVLKKRGSQIGNAIGEDLDKR